MGLSRGVTVYCGTSFADERHTKSSRHPVGPKIRKVKLNKSRRELQHAQQKQKERIASMYPFTARFISSAIPMCSVEFSGATRPLLV